MMRYIDYKKLFLAFLFLILIVTFFWVKEKGLDLFVNNKFDERRVYSLSKEESINNDRFIFGYYPKLPPDSQLAYNFSIGNCWAEKNRLENLDNQYVHIIIEFNASKVIVDNTISLHWLYNQDRSLGKQLISAGQRFFGIVQKNELMNLDTLRFNLKIDNEILPLVLVKDHNNTQ